MRVRFSYLPEQFADPEPILDALRTFVPTGDFTLGAPVRDFEAGFAAAIGARHAVGVNSGTDAIKLALRAAGVGHGDEVITAANTFIATVGAIAELGAVPVFVDCDDTFCLDVGQIEARITPRTRALLPVHLTGSSANMPAVMDIAARHGLPVVEDACQGILAATHGRTAGTWGLCGCYSLHPLKNLNVWADGGVIVTDDDATAEHLRLLRNHGLKNRDEVVLLGHNSRLDSVQAIVGAWLLPQLRDITEARIANAAHLDAGLSAVPGITIPPRVSDLYPQARHVYHLYVVFAEDRDALLAHCHAHGVEAKVHYPIPLYRQAALRHLGYAAGDFPVTDRHARTMITFPADQHLERAHLDHIIATVRAFHDRGG
jgi:dTDP-4-amino-4,6-dideoxygalactose transaminase